MNRRNLLTTVPAALALSGCAFLGLNGTSPENIATVKAYADQFIDAVSAAGNEFLAGNPPPTATQFIAVSNAIDTLQQLKTQIDATVVPTTIQVSLQSVVSLINQILPVVTPFLGPAAPYAPIVLALFNAFIASQAIPPNTPPTPPQPVAEKATTYPRTIGPAKARAARLQFRK